MPRQNTGPRLVLRKKSGYTQSIYAIRWYERGERRERSTGTGDRAEAEAALAEFIAATAATRPDGPRRADQISVADTLTFYGEERAPHLADPHRVAHAIMALLTYWDDKMVSAVIGNTCRAYVRHRQKQGAQVSTAGRELGTLRAAINHCYREGHLLEPRGVVLPPKAPPRERWLGRAEAAALLRGAKNEIKARWHLPLFILIGLYTGARKEAILQLQWQPNTTGGWIDLNAGLMDFNAVDKAKTKKRRSRIPIPDRLRPFLVNARRRTRQHVIEIDGLPVKNVKRSFATACRHGAAWEAARASRLGTEPRFDLKGVHPHVLRHSCITWLMQHGLNDYDVAHFVGATLETIQKTYGHHAPDYLKGPATALNRPVAGRVAGR